MRVDAGGPYSVIRRVNSSATCVPVKAAAAVIDSR